MYNWEIEKFISDRNGLIGGDDLNKVTSIKENPQLTYIKYNAENNEYNMRDNEGNKFTFKAIPYKEVKEKRKSKSLF